MAVELTSTLDGLKNNETEKLYLIDFSKITNVNELVMCLASIGLSISNKNPMFEQIKPFLALEQPFEVPTGV
jgi:hypothetical protein